MPTLSRRGFLGLALTPLAAAGCQSGFPTLFGYRLGADALYDSNIKTIYVPTFQNRAFQTTPYRGFEVDLTQALVTEIGRVTPYRVVSDPNRADTELIGVIMRIEKHNLNRTQQNTVREGELVVYVDVVWRDLRDGTILSAPRKNVVPTGTTLPRTGGESPVPFDPNVPQPPVIVVAPGLVPTSIIETGRYIPELGETNASAMQRVQYRLARKIVEMMENQWDLGCN
jgi:hypothetical protein